MTVETPDAGRQHPNVPDAAWLLTVAAASVPLLSNLAPGGGLLTWERCAAVAIVGIAAWRPLESLLVLAALAPLGTSISALAGRNLTATEWLLPATLAGAAIAMLRGRLSVRGLPPLLTLGVLLLAWLALASVGVQIGADRVRFESADEWRASALSFLGPEYFTGTATLRNAAAGFLLAGQVLLVPLVAAAAAREEDVRRVSSMFALGAAAVATQNVLRVATAAMRTGEGWPSFVEVARTQRISAAFADSNSAGSYLALAALVTGGLLWAAWRARRRPAAAAFGAALAVVAAGLALTGSRIALAVVAPAALVAVLLPRGGPGSIHRRLRAVALAVGITVTLIAGAQARRMVNDAPLAFQVRVEFMKTTWGMLRDHPVFGVGAGEFQPTSARYSSEWLKRFYPTENAHNNYLQVAGELGPFALAAFLMVVGLPVWRVGTAIRAEGAPPLALGLWSGVLAFLLSCASSHPLLIPEVAASFFLALGLLAGLATRTRDAPTARSRRWASIGLIVAAVTLAATVPVRVKAARGSADLEHVLLGNARWTRTGEGPEVRFTRDVAVYVPAEDRPLAVTVRSADRRRAVDVTLRLDGRTANVVRVTGPDWLTVPLFVPKESGRRFRILRLEARYADPLAKGAPRMSLRRIDRTP